MAVRRDHQRGDWFDYDESREIKRLMKAGINHFIDLTYPDELERYDQLLPKDVVHRRFPFGPEAGPEPD